MKNPAGKGGVKKDKRHSPSTPSPNPFPARRPDQTVAAVFQLLQEQWPKCFAVLETRRRPLKLRIDVDIIAALDGAVTQAELNNALRCYVANVAYLRSVQAGAARIDLNGKPAGTVTAEEAEWSLKMRHHAVHDAVHRATIKATLSYPEHHQNGDET